MSAWIRALTGAVVCVVASAASAQGAAPKAEGTLVLMVGSAELEVDNDEATAHFFLELQDADLAKAQSQLNERVAQAMAQIKRTQIKGQLETGGLSAYPVSSVSGSSRANVRNIASWRVRQGVTLRTQDLVTLPKALAAGQQHLALGSLQFSLSRASREKVEAELIARALANFNGKVAAAAQALAVAPQKVRIEELNFGARTLEGPPPMALAAARIVSDRASESGPEMAVESGRATLHQTVQGRVRMVMP